MMKIRIVVGRLTAVAAFALGAAASTSQTLPIQAGSVIAEANPGAKFSALGWKWSAECAGQAIGGLSIPESGIQSSNLGDKFGAVRFGKIDDPFGGQKKVYLFRANVSDPKIWGAPRCELSASPTQSGRLPERQSIWMGFGISLLNWNVGSDEQIVVQWQDTTGNTVMNPFFAISIKGASVQGLIRYDDSYPVSKVTAKTVVLWSDPDLPVAGWSYYVINAKISHRFSDMPYMKVWRDGNLIINYIGPIGYNIPEGSPYLKFGHYQWSDPSNIWDASSPTKSILFSKFVLISDPGQVYSRQTVESFVKN